MMTNMSTLNIVQRACASVLRNGQAVTFTAAADHTGLGRTTFYLDPMIRATIEGNRHRTATSGTLAGLTDEISTVRAVLETLAVSVRRHERATPETDLPRREGLFRRVQFISADPLADQLKDCIH